MALYRGLSKSYDQMQHEKLKMKTGLSTGGGEVMESKFAITGFLIAVVRALVTA